MVRGFGQGEENGHFPYNRPVFFRRYIRIPVGTLNFAADAVMEAGNKGGRHLLRLGHAVEGSMADNKGGMPCMVVKIDAFPHIVEKCGRNEQFTHSVAQAVKRAQAVKEHSRDFGNLFRMRPIEIIQVIQVIVNAEFEDPVEAGALHVIVAGIIFIKQAFPEPAPADNEFAAARKLENRFDNGPAGNDNIGPFT